MKIKVVPKLRQEVNMKVYIVTSYDIKSYYTGQFQDFTARYIIKEFTVTTKNTSSDKTEHNASPRCKIARKVTECYGLGMGTSNRLIEYSIKRPIIE